MYTYYQEIHSEINKLVDEVSGIVDVTMPSNEAILNKILEIKKDITAYVLCNTAIYFSSKFVEISLLS